MRIRAESGCEEAYCSPNREVRCEVIIVGGKGEALRRVETRSRSKKSSNFWESSLGSVASSGLISTTRHSKPFSENTSMYGLKRVGESPRAVEVRKTTGVGTSRSASGDALTVVRVDRKRV